jgi:4-hydroxy-tetrahydrodipicolinate reductase
MIKVILSGANGKMGQVISRLALENENVKIVAGKDINTEQKSDYPVFDNWNDVPTADVIIDFSHPSGLESLLEYVKKTNTPAVVATTGLSEKQLNDLREVSKNSAVFFSANMSLGVNLLIDLVTKATKVLEKNFDIEIIEKHHNQKIDSPSGTALAIANAIADTMEKPCEFVYDRHSVRKKRSKTEIGISSLRGGTIVGDHEVIFAGNDEVIEIKHHAASKEVFAVGSIRAAEFLAGKPAGFYNMTDLVNN